MSSGDKILIAPSLLASDFSCLDRQMAEAEKGGADWFHLDVMDGHFVPNITFGPPVVRSLRKRTRLPLDVHLMISNPDLYLEAFRDAGADVITVHYEACTHLHRTLTRIRELGAKSGVALNPATPVAVLEDLVHEADLILIMSVNPGFGGQVFIRQSLERLKQVRDLLNRSNHTAAVEVDGGVDRSTGAEVVKAGATVLVAGTAIFGDPDISKAVTSLRASLKA